MAKMHYSLPSFNNRNEYIELRTFGFNQPLVIKDVDGTGSYGIYLVRDNTQPTETVDDAIINSHIVSLFDQVGGNITYLTYNNILTEIENSTLVPGSFYGIIDYHTNNKTEFGVEDYHLSPDSTLILQAVSTNELSSKALDLSYPTDEVIYKIDNYTTASLTIKANDVTLVNEYVTYRDYFYEVLIPDGTILDGTFIDEFTLSLGTGTKLLPGTRIACMDPTHQSSVSVYEGTSDVSYDPVTGLLTLLNGYNFKYDRFGTHYLRCSIAGLNITTRENERGIIISRRDVITNAYADFDFRNYRYRLYNAVSSNFHSNGGHGFVLPDSGDFTFATDVSGVPAGYTNDGTSELFPPIDTTQHDPNGIITKSGLKMTNSKYCVIKGYYVKSTIDSCVSTTINTMQYSEVNRTRTSVIGAKLFSSKIETGNRMVFANNTIDTSNIVAMSSCAMSCNIKNSDFKQDFSGWCFNTTNNNIENTTFLGLFQDVKTSQGITLSGIKFSTTSEVYNIIFDETVRNLEVSFNYFENIRFTDAVENSKINVKSAQENLTFSGLINSDLLINSSDVIYNDIIDSTIKFGDDVDSVTVENITNNSIIHNSNYTLKNFSAIVNVDVRTNNIIFELPGEPYDQEEFTFIDMYANSAINNIKIIVSSAPAGGIINTINGGTDKTINKNYGLLTIRYSSTAGWLVITESVTKSDVDNITLGYDVNNDYTIKEIDYIIDDDNESIDGSDTPMSDPHRELVTRAYADKKVAKVRMWTFNDTDINSFDNYCLYHDILKIRDNVKVLVNGIEFTDWDFLSRRQISFDVVGAQNYYASHIQFNVRPVGTVSIEYTEYISPINTYSLLLKRDDDSESVNRMIPSTIIDGGMLKRYLSEFNIVDKFTGKATYTNFNNPLDSINVEKTFSNVAYVNNFDYDTFLPTGIFIEAWGIKNKRAGKGNLLKEYDTKRASHFQLHKFINYNRFDLAQSSFKAGKQYKFRIYDDNTKTVSQFFDEELLIKKLDIFTTDITYSNKKYKGVMYSSRTI